VQADEREKALWYSLQAGDAARAIYAHADAEMHYRTAVELAEEVDDRGLEVEAREKLGGSLTFMARYDDALETYEDLKKPLAETFLKADTPAMINAITQAFPESPFSLRTLFRDEQREIVNNILNESLAAASAAYREIFENNAPLVRFLDNLGIPIPAAFQSAAEIALNSQLKQAFERPEVDIEGIQSSLKEAAATRVKLDVSGLEYGLRTRLEKEADDFVCQLVELDRAQSFRKL
jgi:hypothetical protein